MISSYNALKTLIEETLDANTKGIQFQTTLFNSGKISYDKKVVNNETLNVTTKKCVPAHIVEIVGDFINIPDTSVTENQIAIEFDLMVQNYLDLPFPIQAEYLSCDYQNTLSALEEFKASLLAKRFTLGEKQIYMGGEDSTIVCSGGSSLVPKSFYIEIEPQDTETEEIFSCGLVDKFIMSKGSTNISFIVDDTAFPKVSLSIPYNVKENKQIAVWHDGTDWNMSDGTNTDSQTAVALSDSVGDLVLGQGTGLLAKVTRVILNSSALSSVDFNDIDTTFADSEIDIYDWTSRYVVNFNGTYTNWTGTINNSLTWGKDGNVVFGLETLVPIDNVTVSNDGVKRQLFGLAINCLISNDILFGNDTEYTLDGVSMFPLDRQHTYGTELGTASYINQPIAKSIVEENLKDLTQTFFARPSRKLLQLQKQIKSSSATQNQVYTLIVQYPFFKETYNVVVDSGGSSQNINQLQTLTVTYKEKDNSLS